MLVVLGEVTWGWPTLFLLAKKKDVCFKPLHLLTLFIHFLVEKVILDYLCDETWNNACALVVGGIDCKILEPADFNEMWYSYKFDGPGVRYKLASSI